MTKTILLVEDEQQLIDMYNEIFKRHSNFRLLTANTKEDGLKMAVENKPAVLLLDLIIPEKNGEMVAYDQRVGFDLLRELKQRPAAEYIKVFVFSNIDTHEDRELSDELGAVEYLLKADYTPVSLIEKIKKYV